MSEDFDPIEEFMRVTISRMEHLSTCKRELHVSDCTCDLNVDRRRLQLARDRYIRQSQLERARQKPNALGVRIWNGES